MRYLNEEMNDHLNHLRQQVASQERRVEDLEADQVRRWREFDEADRALTEIKLKRERETLKDLRELLNRTLISYHEINLAEKSLPFGKRMFPADRVETILQRLSVPLSHEDVSTRIAGGKNEVVYIETFKALEKAQEVFGFDMSLEIRGEPSLIFQQNNKIVMKAIVRITLANGCFHEDVGIGVSVLSDPSDAIRMAAKAAVSDSIKRTLQHFGPALGSCLRDKEWVSSDLTPAVQASRSSATKSKPHASDDGTKRSRYTMNDQQPMGKEIPRRMGQPCSSSMVPIISLATSAPSSSAGGTVSTFQSPPLEPKLVVQVKQSHAIGGGSNAGQPMNSNENMIAYSNPVASNNMHHTSPNHVTSQSSSGSNQKNQQIEGQNRGTNLVGELDDDEDLARAYDEIMRQYSSKQNQVASS